MNKVFKRQFSFCAVALAATLAATGCSESPEAEQQAQPAAPVAELPGMEAPLTQGQAGAQYRIAAEPVLVQNGDVIRTVVSVTNNGKTAINSHGKFPVNLAVSLVDGAGAMVAIDFVRTALPAEGIPTGGSADVVTEVPAKDVSGNSLRFGLVQEGVAWYSDFNVATVDYGPLTSCEDQGKQTVCGKEGKPLAHAESQ